MEKFADHPVSSSLETTGYFNLSGVQIYQAAIKGDPIAKAAFETTGEIFGKSLADAVTFTSPEAIILVGGLANAGNLLIEPTLRSMQKNMLAIFTKTVRIIQSNLQKGNIAILGASALCWHELS